jgi:hypothetical protein
MSTDSVASIGASVPKHMKMAHYLGSPRLSHIIVVIITGAIGWCAMSMIPPNAASEESEDGKGRVQSKLSLTGRFVDKEPATTLRVIATNTGRDTIKVDKDLVFLLHFAFYDQRGELIAPERVKSDKATKRVLTKDEANRRFVTLRPDESIARDVLPFDGFRVFEYGISESRTEILATGYECRYVLPKSSKLHHVRVTYGLGHGLPEGFKVYANQSLEELGVFQGSSTVELGKRDQ